MKKIIITVIAVVAAIIPFQGSFALAADSFFGAGATSHPFGTDGPVTVSNGSFGAGAGYNSDDSFFGSGNTNQTFGTCGDNCVDDHLYSHTPAYTVDPCSVTRCYPQHDNSEYQGTNVDNANGNSNESVNNNNNNNVNEIYINIYGNGSVTGSGIDTSDLPSCNDARDNDGDGRIDFNDSDCMASGRENGKNARINSSAPTFVSVAPVSAREGSTYVYDADARDEEGDSLTYSFVQNPSGMTIDNQNGLIRWTPTAGQAGIAHGVTVLVSDGTRQATQSFQIFVEKIVVQSTRQAGSGQAEGRVASANTVAVAQAADKNTLHVYNIRVDTDELGNSVVTWDATQPSRGRVIFGRASQADRSGTDFTGTAQYEFATPNTPETSTSHRVILGQLEGERVYYFRVVSFAGTDTTASSERSFVQLPNGETLGSEAGFASVIGTLGSFLISPWFLFLLIIVIVLILVFRRRNQQEIVAHDLPVEKHNAGHH